MKKRAYILLGILLICGLIIPNESPAQQSEEIILAGYKHKPPVPTSGSGLATITFKNDTLKVSGNFENLTGHFSGAYIMVSLPRGQGGNQIYRLKAQLNDEKTGGTLKAEENTFVLSKAEKELLKNGNLYINISSFEHQSGELRGNIESIK